MGKRGRKPNTETSWEQCEMSKVGTQVKIQFYLPFQTVADMKRSADMLVELEKIKKGYGLEESTPHSYCKYCCKWMTEILEKMRKEMEENAVAPTTPDA